MTYWKLMGNSEVNSIEIYTSFSLSLLLSAPLFCLIRIKTVNVNNIWRICRKECLKTHFNSSKRNIIWLRWSRHHILHHVMHIILFAARQDMYNSLILSFNSRTSSLRCLIDLMACLHVSKTRLKYSTKRFCAFLNISNFL